MTHVTPDYIDVAVAYPRDAFLAFLEASFPSMLDPETGKMSSGVDRTPAHETGQEGVIWCFQIVRILAEEEAQWQALAAAGGVEILAQCAYDHDDIRAVYDAIAEAGAATVARYHQVALLPPAPIHDEGTGELIGYSETSAYYRKAMQ